MSIEIERKFLVRSNDWLPADHQERDGREIVQGYLSQGPVTVRVRRAGDHAALTIKGPARGLSRQEFEYTIPDDDARELLALCGNRLVHKTRYRVLYEGHLWEVDEFAGDNAGLVVAEVELTSEDETPPHPPWLGPEVSADRRFSNASLADRPYTTWTDEERGRP